MGVHPTYGLCTGCGYVRACRVDGTVGSHQYATPRGRRTGQSCPGIGHKPAKYMPRPTVSNGVNPARQGG